MSNCAIWVEGISDRRYLQAFLLAYIRDERKKKYLEDLHYSFFEYAGTNLVHYLFDDSEEDVNYEKIKAHFLANRIFLLSDKDEGKDKKHEELELLNKRNGSFEYAHTKVIEVENLLSKSILKKIFEDIFRIKKETVQKLRFSEKDYINMRMGEFIHKKIKNHLTFQRKIQGDSGTLKTDYKNKLSSFVLKKVIDNELNWDMIKENKAAEELTIKIYNFIQKQNMNQQ